MARVFKGPAVRSRTGTVSRLCAAIFASALLTIGPAAHAQQAATGGSAAPARPVHSSSTHHKAAAHHAHNGASRRSHSSAHRSAAHRAAASRKTPVKAKSTPETAPTPAKDLATADQTPAAPASEGTAAATATAPETPAAEVKTPEASTTAGAVTPASNPVSDSHAADQPAKPAAPAEQATQAPQVPAATPTPSQPAETSPAAATSEQSVAPTQQSPTPSQPVEAETSAQNPAPAAANQSSASAQSAPAQAATDQSAPAQSTVTISVAPDQTGQQAQPAPIEQAGQGQLSGAQPSTPDTSAADFAKGSAATEEDLRKMLVGKPLYLRGGYLDNNLTFGETGMLIGHSPQGSYTLAGIQIDRVHLSKHKVELEGARYGLHFLGALPYEDPTKAVDRVKITPKKKFVKITIDRELIVTPKKKKQKDQDRNAKSKVGPGGLVMPAEQPEAAPAVNSTDTGSAPDSAQAEGSADKSQTPAAPQTANAAQTGTTVADAAKEPTDEEAAKAEMAAAPQEERPADPNSVTTTTSPAHAAKVLKDALDNIFAPGLDDRMMAAMPDFWKHYYEAVAARTDYRPKDATVLRQAGVDQKAVLTSNFEPESNDFAQDAGVAGMCLYHTVIGADGKPGEIAVARPIGFGLDENAVSAIRKASFQPAMKDGKAVPVVLDLVVQFRIYSKRTNVASKPEDKDKAKGPQLPGPYTLQAERTNQAQAKTQTQ